MIQRSSRVVMLAPELPGALELIAALDAADIVPAAGHTMAQVVEVMARDGRIPDSGALRWEDEIIAHYGPYGQFRPA